MLDWVLNTPLEPTISHDLLIFSNRKLTISPYLPLSINYLEPFFIYKNDFLIGQFCTSASLHVNTFRYSVPIAADLGSKYFLIVNNENLRTMCNLLKLLWFPFRNTLIWTSIADFAK